MEKFPVIVVGGGLAGLAAAYTLARSGIEVLIIERGDYAGAKNASGGRLYLEPVRSMLPDLWQGAVPLERKIVKEGMTLVGKEASLSIELTGELSGGSYSILRARFDRWLAEVVEEAGAMIMTKTLVTGLVKEGEQVTGVRVGDEVLHADWVIAADGVLSLMAEGISLHKPTPAYNMAVGVKEVIALEAEKIEERFQLDHGEGAARLFIGEVTAGKFGGGFLYTNRESVSLGIVMALEGIEDGNGFSIPKLLDNFKRRPEVEALIRGGKTVEYAAHLIPEGGKRGLLPLYAPGLLVVGDAAGLALNMGFTVRGMDYALASGCLAGRAIAQGEPARYPDLLRETFVLKDFTNYAAMRDFLSEQDLYTRYPQKMVDFFLDLYTIPPAGKDPVYTILRRHFPWREIWHLWRTGKKLRKT